MQSKNYAILLGFVFLVGSSFFVGNSFSQGNEPNLSLSISAQTQVRDAQDKLVTYLESDVIKVIDENLLNRFLDLQPVVKTIKQDNQDFEMITVNIEQNFDHFSAIGITAIAIKGEDSKAIVVASTRHDGFLVAPGDTVTTQWTVIRPAS